MTVHYATDYQSQYCLVPSMVAEKYNASLRHDRNDIFKYHRIGDLNQRSFQGVVGLQQAWTSAALSAARPHTVVQHINACLVYVCHRSEAQTAATLLRKLGLLKTRSIGRSDKTLRMAAEAVGRQTTKTDHDVQEWIKQIVADVQDADD